METNIPVSVLLSAYRAFLDGVFDGIRAIAIRRENGTEYLVRYYMKKRPTDDEVEIANIACTEMLADFSDNSMVSKLDVEFCISDAALENLDPLTQFLFTRYEGIFSE